MEAFESYEIDLAVEQEREAFEKEVANVSGYFNPVSDVSYKIKFTSSKLKAVEKDFKDGKKVKYQAQIEAINNKGEKFSGIWELGVRLADSFTKGYREKGLNQVYIYTKTGTGLLTEHNLVKDF